MTTRLRKIAVAGTGVAVAAAGAGATAVAQARPAEAYSWRADFSLYPSGWQCYENGPRQSNGTADALCRPPYDRTFSNTYYSEDSNHLFKAGNSTYGGVLFANAALNHTIVPIRQNAYGEGCREARVNGGKFILCDYTVDGPDFTSNGHTLHVPQEITPSGAIWFWIQQAGKHWYVNQVTAAGCLADIVALDGQSMANDCT